ncbi:unnamed protein product [Coregonus sp. 'balchen']|nr:unnamed protein product [Coregonus sp. 'balchen']
MHNVKRQIGSVNVLYVVDLLFSSSCSLPQEMKYLCIPAADASKQNLTPFFKDSIVFIHESRLKGKGCLVHCVAGVSRSVTLVVAYIMTVTGRGWVESLAAVRVVRPCAGPNVGFLRQLEDFENLEVAQYRVWFKDRYKENLFNDEEEIGALLLQKSQAISESIATATATAAQLATSNT